MLAVIMFISGPGSASNHPCVGLQVYLGKWHGSEVAVKCLNPGLFFGGGEANNHAAVNELVKEADMLGR